MIILKENQTIKYCFNQNHLNSNMIILKVLPLPPGMEIVPHLNSNMIILKVNTPIILTVAWSTFKFQYDNT